MNAGPDDDVLAALRDPATLATFGARRLTDLIARARGADVLGRIAARARRRGALADLPARLHDLLVATELARDAHRRRLAFETDRLARLLRGTTGIAVLLKGAAYAACGMPAAEGRAPGDIDVMVPRADVAAVEARLCDAGWEPAILAPHAQRYFRAWMHEVPPLRHRERGTLLDLHHAILPPRGRVAIDPRQLLDASVAVPRLAPLAVLAPEDMTLHCIAHQFQDGEFRHTLRELVDLDDLVGQFGAVPGFWPRLVARTGQLGLGRPARYALIQARDLLATPVPAAALTALAGASPPSPLDEIVRRAMRTALRASGRSPHGAAERAGARLLVLRAHWLKLPPTLLLRHALAKLTARITSAAGRRAS